MRLTRDEILDAADKIASGSYTNLREAFGRSRQWGFPQWDRFARACGGVYAILDHGSSRKGREQRLTFLAFMLAWHDDITATTTQTGKGGAP